MVPGAKVDQIFVGVDILAAQGTKLVLEVGKMVAEAGKMFLLLVRMVLANTIFVKTNHLKIKDMKKMLKVC